MKKLLLRPALGLVGLAAMAGAASAATAYTETALNLRSGPGTGYGVIVSMPAGAPVEVIDCYGGGWCEVAWAGYRGFASEAYLSGSGYVAPAPVYRAPSYYPPTYYGYSRGPSIGFYYYDNDRDHRHRRHYRRDRDHDWRDRDRTRHYTGRDRDHDRRGHGSRGGHRGGGTKSYSTRDRNNDGS